MAHPVETGQRSSPCIKTGEGNPAWETGSQKEMLEQRCNYVPCNLKNRFLGISKLLSTTLDTVAQQTRPGMNRTNSPVLPSHFHSDIVKDTMYILKQVL
ncbi:hypothetical protein I79_005924 [Cricetulus griseus]|uniref:Uncharacterized protein n=1 Tax=Cricetulus griseus TaxID=10029 RepID=G3H6G5_CRIGR|nr:hypothetical protein I79_005924 [Cricetulus griseus]